MILYGKIIFNEAGQQFKGWVKSEKCQYLHADV